MRGTAPGSSKARRSIDPAPMDPPAISRAKPNSYRAVSHQNSSTGSFSVCPHTLLAYTGIRSASLHPGRTQVVQHVCCLRCIALAISLVRNGQRDVFRSR